jgi:hypothetical protein
MTKPQTHTKPSTSVRDIEKRGVASPYSIYAVSLVGLSNTDEHRRGVEDDIRHIGLGPENGFKPHEIVAITERMFS